MEDNDIVHATDACTTAPLACVVLEASRTIAEICRLRPFHLSTIQF
jgi:hypothetical protein